MPLLEVQRVCRSFGGLKALDHVTLSVDPGRIFAVIGPNGAGKTTLFNIISGMLRPDAGTITFDGTPITGLPPYRICRLGLARTYQTLDLFENMTAIENVMVGRHPRTCAGFFEAAFRLNRHRREERDIRNRAAAHLRTVGLAGKAEAPVAALSFGQRRLVELARALATEPRLLLLDEPASGLNPAETEELARLIRQIRDAGITVLLVEHDMSMVMDVSDEILMLHYGCTVTCGPPEEIRNNPEVIDIYLGGAISSAAG